MGKRKRCGKVSLTILLAILAFLTISLVNNSFADAPWTLYDDFSDTHINTVKWDQGELVREIDTVVHKLFLKYGTPNYYIPYSELTFVDPGSVNSIQADVAILENGIGSSGSTTARLGGRWFNDGTTPGGGMAGDIWAEVSLQGGPSGVSANWNVSKYTDSSGNSSPLGSGSFTTSITLGTSYTLYISYDDVANQFTFRVGTEEIKFGPTNLPSRVGDAGSAYKSLQAYTSQGYVSASFDNVYKNGDLYDDFSSSLINPAKWFPYELVKEVTSGKFRSKLRSSSEDTTTLYLGSGLQFTDPSSINSIQAKVTPTIYQNNESVDARICLLGHFFNDGTGDAYVQICIGGSEATPKAGWASWRYPDAGGDIYYWGSGMFATPVEVGNTYTLSIRWDGSRLTLKINDEEAIFAPPSATFGPPKTLYKAIVASIPGNWGRNALFEVLFDDVEIESNQDTWYELAVSKAGTGTGSVSSSPGGIDCGADCNEKYSRGTVVTLTAAPDPDSSFSSWSGACTGTSPSCQLRMNASKTATAHFGR